jgi:hypothetical protein
MSLPIEIHHTSSNRPANPTFGLGCLGLFFLPFAGMGLVNVISGIRRGMGGNWPDGMMHVLLGLVPVGFAMGGIALVAKLRTKAREQEAIRKAHPDQPWLWRREWAAGRIPDASRSTMWISWGVTAFWNLISIPAGVLGVRAALQQGNQGGYVALLFPAVGLGFFIWAVRATLRHRRYGVSRLELSTIPGAIGRSLAGTVRVSTPLQPSEGFDVTLRCVRRITIRSGKNSSTTERILWQEERRVKGETSRDAHGFSTRIPVRFAIPADAEASDEADVRNQVIWRLELSANVPGVDYASTFEVPVFRTTATAYTEHEAQIAPDEPNAEPYRQPSNSRILVTTNRRGTEILFSALRNPGVAAGFVAFTLAWTGAFIVLVKLHAPLLFPIVFGLFWILLVIGTLQQCLGVSRVIAQPGSLIIAQGYLSAGGERTIPAPQIADIKLRIGMQAGLRPYYDVMVVKTNGKQVAAGRWVRDKREAEWLAATLKSALELSSRRSEVPAGHDG